jgi:hypothetical protein
MTTVFQSPAFDVKGIAFLSAVEHLLDVSASYAHEGVHRMIAVDECEKRVGECQFSSSDRDGQRRWVIDAFSHSYGIGFRKEE